MTTVHQIVRAAIPAADADTVQFIMWNRTPFPFERMTARSIYRAASGWRRACDKDIRLCDHCHNIAVPGQWECQRCRDALRAALDRHTDP